MIYDDDDSCTITQLYVVTCKNQFVGVDTIAALKHYTQAYVRWSVIQRLYSVKSQMRQQLGSNYESQSPKHLPLLVVLATPFEAISTLHMYMYVFITL